MVTIMVIRLLTDAVNSHSLLSALFFRQVKQTCCDPGISSIIGESVNGVSESKKEEEGKVTD